MLGYPKLYKRDELNKLLTGDIPGTYKRYWNNAYDYSYSTTLPYTANGCTWSFNADGSINCSGTLASTYSSWYFLQNIPGCNDDLRICAGHKYIAARSTSTQVGTYSTIAEDTTNNIFYFKVDALLANQTPRMYYAATGIAGDVINENFEYPWIIDLTAIYGAGNEPATIDANLIKLAKYARKHPEYKQDVWYINGKKWTWRAYIIDTGLAIAGDAFTRCEEKFPCTAGDVIRVKSRTLLAGYVFNIGFFASDGTFISRSTYASSSVPSCTAPDNAAYYMLALRKNGATVITAENVIAVDIMTAIMPNNYNNKYNLDTGADNILPYTQNGITFSRNADGSIHAEGTVGSAQNYAQWYFCGISKNNYFLVPGHYYYQNWYSTNINDIKVNQYPMNVVNKSSVNEKGRIFQYNSWTGSGSNHWYNYAGLSYIVSDTGTTVNSDAPAPVVVDLTDIFGYGQEPISLSDSRMINLINYIDIVGTGYVNTQWLIDGNRWTYRKHLSSAGYESNALCDFIEQEFAVNPGDTITFSNTSICYKYILWYNGSTVMYRDTIDGTTFTAAVPANATKAVISINNNFTTGGNIPSNLDAINFSVSITPAPTPSSHAVVFQYPFTVNGTEITGPGTYNFEIEGEGITNTLTINSNMECTVVAHSDGTGSPMAGIVFNFENMKATGTLEANKHYLLAFDKQQIEEDNIYMFVVSTNNKYIKHSAGSTEWLGSEFSQLYSTPGEEPEITDAPIDTSDLQSGDYYTADEGNENGEVIIQAYFANMGSETPVFYTDYTTTFTLALDEVE